MESNSVTSKLNISRRGFVAGVTAVAFGSIAGCTAGGGGASVLIGPLKAKPAPDSTFFDAKIEYTYIYVAEDDGTVWVISDEVDDWIQSI